MAFGGAGGGQQAFVLQGGDDVGVLAAAVLLVDGPVHEVVTGGGHDAAHVLGDDLVLHVVLDGAGGADLGAHAALALGHLTTIFGIDDRLLGDGLREGDVDGRGGTGEFVEGVRRLLAGAFFRAGAAAGAQAPVHIGGALADLDGEVAHVAGDVFHFRHGVQGDVGMLGHVHHLGAQDAGRAVHGGEGLVQLGHLAADGGLAFHQHHGHAAVGAVQGGLDAGHTAADDQHALVDVEGLGEQRLVVAQLGNGHLHQFGGLVGVGHLVLADPGDVLADVGHFEHVAVQAGAFHGAAERGLVHARAAGGHHHAVQLVLVDGRLDGGLAGLGAGVHEVHGVDHIGIGSGRLGDLGAINGAADIAAAVTDENAYSHALSPSGAWAFWASSRWVSRMRSTRALALTTSLSRPSSLGSMPKARPIIWV